MSSAAGQWVPVGEAARLLGLSRTTLLAAEESGLISAARTPGGHRRYRSEELVRYLRAIGGDPLDGPSQAVPPGEGSGRRAAGADSPTVADSLTAGAAPPPAAAPQQSAACIPLRLGVRAALRPLVQALGAGCAGVYLLLDGRATFCAAYGVPRWLSERLATAPPPAPVQHALAGGRHQLFDPAVVAFPEPRSSGRGIAVSLPRDGDPQGVLFVVTAPDREPFASDLATVDAHADVLALLVQSQRRIAVLEERLRRIADLSH